MYRCPVPNCPEPFITNYFTQKHCELYHNNIPKKEIIDTYGVPQWIPITQNLLNKNLADYVAYGTVNRQYSIDSTVKEQRKTKERSSIFAI